MEMFSYVQAITLGALQGFTELFPISSLGHSVILPKLLGWHINQNDSYFLVFLVATHTATALVLFGFFWRDWMRIFSGILRSIKNREIKESDVDAKLGWLLVVATIPAGILGLLFDETLKKLFASPNLVAGVLILNGFMLLLAERLRRKKENEKSDAKNSDSRIAKLKWTGAVKVGIMQGLALFPGFSRTGASMTGSLFVGLSHEDAARYAFLLATPLIAAASVLKLPEMINQNNSQLLGQIITGSVFSGITAYFSVKFLLKYFQTNSLTPFAIYCVGFGIVCSLLFLIR